MNKSKNFKEEQLIVLELYIKLEATKFSTKKKDLYDEIQRKTKYNRNTIISWIKRYLAEYKEIRKEISEKQNKKICNFEGLTEKQTNYVICRMSGISKEEAKEKAGYSDKTKAANIEKSPKVATKIAELREILFQDTELGMLSIANRLNKILNDSINGVEIVEYIEEVGPEGTTTTKKKRKDKQLLAGVAAARELNSMLGYKATDELKLEEAKKKEKEKQLVLLE
nr:MAG TPA: terminase small subunit [Caudoviricetes sp.]